MGLILCSEQDNKVAHYALEGLRNTVLAREYQLALPDERRLAKQIEETRHVFLSLIISSPLTTIISPYQRQLLFDSWVARSAIRRAEGEARPAVPGFSFWDKEMAVGKWETCFWFSTFPSASSPELWKCGNLAWSWRDFQGPVETGESLLLAFHGFHRPVISTALRPAFFRFRAGRHLIRPRPGFPPVDSSWHAPPGSWGYSTR